MRSKERELIDAVSSLLEVFDVRELDVLIYETHLPRLSKRGMAEHVLSESETYRRVMRVREAIAECEKKGKR